MARNNAMMVSKPSIDMADDGDGAWTTFSAAWPYDAVDYRRAAAKAEFERSPTPAERLPDGRWRLHPGSLQLQRWHEHERRTLGRARLGLTRPSEWPADVLSSACVGDRSRRRSARGDR